MKSFKVYDSYGFLVKGWSFGTFKGINIGNHLDKPRQIVGWQLNSPDGIERFSEGNWQQFVPFVHLVVGNYGCKTNLS